MTKNKRKFEDSFKHPGDTLFRRLLFIEEWDVTENLNNWNSSCFAVVLVISHLLLPKAVCTLLF